MQILRYGDSATTLRGQIYTDYFFGRPGYGETPEIDELEHSILLALDEPFSIPGRESECEGDYEAAGCSDVRSVQIAGAVDVQYLREIRGHGVELTGALFAAHTGHHHAKVLINMQAGATVLTDERNTYPGAEVTRTGTGFLIGHDGLVATAAHVVAGALGITVTRGLFRAKATLEDIDLDTDLAMLKLAPTGVMASVIAQREALVRPFRRWMPVQLGERVYAFGFPLRPILQHTLNMTEGIVSAESGLRGDRFQTSAPIQKGNSGGPVYDQHANLVGVVTSKLRPIGNAVPENVSFVIRADRLFEMCRGLGVKREIEESRISHPPVVLGKLMQQLCVEVECWEQSSAAGC